ncbi:hypothetical protein FAGAP_8344 [Fusarium agapanthi]|uniref:Uncharacterized protein n=1 Tax=Fusarium agapanthi TaxID=1803897 RepID=A0A9P5B491_9HYPO|nr:hypothetical protein FAGAP_8344 [Fusarium agapanthi]
MSRAEENSAWAETEQDYWKRVRNKKSLENEKIDNEFQLLLNEISNRLDALKEWRTKLVIETETKLSLINDAIKKETAHLEELRHKYRVSREMRNNENRHLWTEMRGWFREQKGEDPHTPDDKGPESEGLILRNELPGLLSAADGSAVQRELTNGTGAMADRPEEASDKRSTGGLKCHNIETAKTPEVQPKIEPTNQIKLQEVRQVEKKIVPPGQPLPSHIYEPPSKGRWEQLSGESSRGHKRPGEGQHDGFYKRQATVTGEVFYQPDKCPILRVPEQNRTPTQISRDPQSISQSPTHDPLYGTSGHLSAGSVQKLQPPGYSPTAAAQRLQPASNIPPRHSQTPDSQMTDPRTHSLLNPDSYGTEGRDMRSGEPTATNSQQPSQDTSRVESFRNTTVSDANSIMRGVAPSGSFKTLERRRRQAQDRERRRQAQDKEQRRQAQDKEQILRDVAIMAMQAVDARVGHIKEES